VGCPEARRAPAECSACAVALPEPTVSYGTATPFPRLTPLGFHGATCTADPSKPKAVRPGTRLAISSDAIRRAEANRVNDANHATRSARPGPTAHAVGLPRRTRRIASHRSVPPCDQRGVAHTPGDGVSGERSQDGGAKPMPSEPKGMDARRERPATGCGQSRSVASTHAPPSRRRRRDGGDGATVCVWAIPKRSLNARAPKPETTPGRRRRRDRQRVGNPEARHHTRAPKPVPTPGRRQRRERLAQPRLLRKNSVRILPHSSANTWPTCSTRWLRRASSKRR